MHQGLEYLEVLDSRHLDVFLIQFDYRTEIRHDHMIGVGPHRDGQLRVLAQVPVFAVHGDKIPRVRETVNKLQFFLPRVAGVVSRCSMLSGSI